MPPRKRVVLAFRFLQCFHDFADVDQVSHSIAEHCGEENDNGSSQINSVPTEMSRDGCKLRPTEYVRRKLGG